MSASIALRQLTKLYGKTVAVDHIDLDIPAGSLFFLLGPSGCGKTTLLRMLAGFIEPTAGSIAFDGKGVTHLPANKRNCGMVFQSYALWPHMSVKQNVAFGLTVRKVPPAEARRRVEAALKSVQMQAYADRKPNELSGGQQQRVALARAMVVEPTLLLLDEPLSNLDAKLRVEMRSTIRRVCKAANITGVYVTHDQKEALSMADRMAVLRAGKVEQVGEPRALYDRPANRFVADFLGETNFLSAVILGREGAGVLLETPAGRLLSRAFPADLPQAGGVTVSIRPEALRLVNGAAPGPGMNAITTRRVESTYLGEVAQHQLAIGDQATMKAFELNPRHPTDAGETIRIEIAPEDVVILQD
jgi:iron(III) transport system ATP-binding protein